MESAALPRSFFIVLLALTLLLLLLCLTSILPASGAFSPHQGDYFKYSETIDLGNGTGSYSGYTEHETVSGGENVTGVSESTVSMKYGYSYQWSNSSGTTRTGSSGGPFTFSDDTFHYVNGTDNQTSFGGVAYVNPAVWFAMNNSLPSGANFTILNTQMKIVSTNATVFLPTENENVRAIYAAGSGSYQRNDIYGQFGASYAWAAWYDPTTGYIIGYNYVEHDTNPNGDGFGYADKLYVSSSSYSLSVAGSSSASSSSAISSSSSQIASTTQQQTNEIPWLDYALIIVVIAAIAAFFLIRRHEAPKGMGTP